MFGFFVHNLKAKKISTRNNGMVPYKHILHALEYSPALYKGVFIYVGSLCIYEIRLPLLIFLAYFDKVFS